MQPKRTKITPSQSLAISRWWSQIARNPTEWMGFLGSEIAAQNRKSLATFHRNLKSPMQHCFLLSRKSLRFLGSAIRMIFQPASWLEKLLEGLLRSLGGFGRKFPEGGPDFLEVASVWKFLSEGGPRRSRWWNFGFLHPRTRVKNPVDFWWQIFFPFSQENQA